MDDKNERDGRKVPRSGNQGKGRKPKQNGGHQPRKDSKDPRVNFDNTREQRFKRDVRMSEDNASYWYKDKNHLAETAADHINFVHPTGFAEIVPNSSSQGSALAVPGVMALAWSPIIAGRARKIVQQAMDSQLSFVVHKNSRNLSYDAQDMMILELGTGLGYSFLANMIRAYGVMREYEG